jgi:hypothetical protein
MSHLGLAGMCGFLKINFRGIGVVYIVLNSFISRVLDNCKMSPRVSYSSPAKKERYINAKINNSKMSS